MTYTNEGKSHHPLMKKIYIFVGYLNVFIEISKSSDLGRIFYDPLTGEHNTYTEEQLEEFATKLAIN